LRYKLAFEINSIPGWENGIPFSYLNDEFMNNPILLDLAVSFLMTSLFDIDVLDLHTRYSLPGSEKFQTKNNK
jgi:hypothetical protein